MDRSVVSVDSKLVLAVAVEEAVEAEVEVGGTALERCVPGLAGY